MEENDLQGLDRFRPSGNTKVKKSISKRVAAFVFVGAGAAFAMIMLAIAGSEQIVNSSAPPKEIVEPSSSRGIIPPIELRQPEPEPEEEEEEENYTNSPSTVQPQIQSNMPTVVLPQMQPPVVQQPVRTTVMPAYGRRETRRPYVTMSRRTAQEARLQAASAPTTVSNFGGGGGQTAANGMAGVEALDAAMDTSSSSNSNMMDMGTSGTSNVTAMSDPNGWSRKDAFLNQALPNEYSRNSVIFQRSDFELKAGTIIPCVLISGMNSDLPGNAIAQVSENVWDTATGKYLLIPRGSRLIGTYDNQVTYGQNRALVIWSRLIFPDGSSLTLDNLKGSDQSGYAGFKGQVNNHWSSIISAALLVSLVGAGAQAVQDDSNNNNNNNNSNRRSFGDVLSERVATSIADAMTQIIQRNVQRQPTLKIKPGYRFTIFVQHDIVFPGSWRR